MIVLEGGQAFITCQVYARSENSDQDFIFMRTFTIKANPLFRLYDHTSGIYAPSEDWEKELGDAKPKKWKANEETVVPKPPQEAVPATAIIA